MLRFKDAFSVMSFPTIALPITKTARRRLDAEAKAFHTTPEKLAAKMLNTMFRDLSGARVIAALLDQARNDSERPAGRALRAATQRAA